MAEIPKGVVWLIFRFKLIYDPFIDSEKFLDIFFFFLFVWIMCPTVYIIYAVLIKKL